MTWHPWGQLRGLPRSVWVLWTAVLVNRSGTMVLPFLVLYLTRSLGLSPSRAALALAVYGIGAVITAPLAGRLADRSGPRRIVIGSLFVSAILLLFMPLARTLPSVLAMTLAWAVAGEALRPASLAWLTDLVPPDRRRAGFALNRLAVNLGMSLGPAIAGFVAQVSFTAIFVLDALTSMLAGALLLLATRAGPHDALPAEAAAGAEPDRRRAWRDPAFLYFLAAILPVQIVFFQHEAAMPLFLVRDLGLAESAYGLMFTINTLMVILIEVPLNSAMSEWSYRRTLATGAFLIGAGFGALGLARGGWSASATVVVWTFGEMILLPCTAAFVAEAAPPARRGEYLGLYSMSFSSAFAVAPWIGARIMESWGSRVVWACSFAAGLVSVAMVRGLRAPAPGRHAPGDV
ncbi:MAG TPA: MFS transporter [Patescibacteria group bacterium]|nr:MFS transporter [Patescibacteria group bacterium]